MLTSSSLIRNVGNFNFYQDPFFSGTITGDHIITDNIQDLDFTGFLEWTPNDTPPIWDITGNVFTLIKGVCGYIKSRKIEALSGQTITLTSFSENYLYIDEFGFLQKTAVRNENIFLTTLVVFGVFYNGVDYLVSKENHTYNFPTRISWFLHEQLGSIFSGIGVFQVGTATNTLQIPGSGVVDNIEDHGIETDIIAQDPIKLGFMYVDVATHWVIYAGQSIIPPVWNNAGVVTAMTNNWFGVFKIYAVLDNINSTDPQYLAIIHTSEYVNQNQAENAVSDDLIAKATNELLVLEPSHFGDVIIQNIAGTSLVVLSIISKDSAGGRASGALSTSHLTLTDINGGVYLTGGHDFVSQATFKAASNPGAGDDISAYQEAAIWIRQDNDKAFLNTDNTASNAVWRYLGSDQSLYTTDDVKFNSITDGTASWSSSNLSGFGTITSTGITSSFYKSYHSFHDSSISSGGDPFIRVLTATLVFDDGCEFAIGMINAFSGARVCIHGIITRDILAATNVHIFGTQRSSGINGFALSDAGTDLFIELSSTVFDYNEYQVWILNRFCGNGANTNFWVIDTSNTDYTLAALKATFGYNYIGIAPDDTFDISLNGGLTSLQSLGGKEGVFLEKKMIESSGDGILDFSINTETNAYSATYRFGYDADVSDAKYQFYKNTTQNHELGTTGNSYICGSSGNLAIGKIVPTAKVDISGDVVISDDITLSKNEAKITHSGATKLTVSSTSGDVYIESVKFNGTAISGSSSITSDSFTDGTATLALGSLTGTVAINSTTAAELSQLETIDATTISSVQWGYLGGMTYNTTYNPVMGDGSNNFTMSVQESNYFVTGDQVAFQYRLLWSSKGSPPASGNIQITLPFSTTRYSSYSIGRADNITFSTQLTAYNFGATFFQLYDLVSGGIAVTLTDASYGTTGTLIVGGIFFKA
jgi:hypothetical protein